MYILIKKSNPLEASYDNHGKVVGTFDDPVAIREILKKKGAHFHTSSGFGDKTVERWRLSLSDFFYHEVEFSFHIVDNLSDVDENKLGIILSRV